MDQYSHGRSFSLRVWHIGLLLVICFFCMFAAFALTGRNKLEKEIAAIRAAGYPTNFEELDIYYSIPEGVPNAADVYRKAFDAYQEPDEELKKHLPISRSIIMAVPRGPLDSDSVEAIISHVQANKETLEFLDKAVVIEHCRHDLDFNKWGMLHNPYWNEMKKCAKLLAEQTMLLAHQGDGDAAVKNVAKQLAQADSLKKEPMLTSQLVRMACTAISRSSVEYILNRTTLTDEQLTGLQQRLSQVYQDDPMVMGLIGKRCWINRFFNNSQDWKLLMTTSILFRTPGVKDRNCVKLLELYGQYIDAMNLPGRQRLTRCGEISAEVEGLSIFYSFMKMFARPLKGVALRDLQYAAQTDCAIVALGIERYRLAKGALPKVLGDLVPQYIDKVPIDPFDGKPVRYKLTEPGYIVYCIGEDGTDEGGLEMGNRKGRSDPYDWPFIVEH